LHHAEQVIGCARREYSVSATFRLSVRDQQRDTAMTAAVQDRKMRFERLGPVCINNPPKVADAR
jgi:hypothetical protein